MAVLDSFDGTRTRAELIEEFGEDEVCDLLAQLEELSVLEDASDDDLITEDVYARFDRQLRYFSDISTGPTPSQCQSRLEEAKIAVLGVGGLGGWSALNLACCGVGEMMLIDFDKVERSNLNRQVLYTEDDIGRHKVVAAAERLEAFNSAMRVEAKVQKLDSEEAVIEAIKGYDVVIDACDWPAHDIEHWINSACFKVGVAFVAMSHFPPIARVGPFYVPTLRRGDGAAAGPRVAGGDTGAGLWADRRPDRPRHPPLPDRPRAAFDPRHGPHLRPAHDVAGTGAGGAGARLPGLRPPEPRAARCHPPGEHLALTLMRAR
jgi:hypothetical protein